MRRGDVLARSRGSTRSASRPDLGRPRGAPGRPACRSAYSSRGKRSPERSRTSSRESRTAPCASGSRSRTASNRALRTNLRVDVLVVTGVRDGAPAAPARAVRPAGGAAGEVFVVQDDRARKRRVRFGLAGHDFLEVTDGLAEGDEVIVSDMTDYQSARELRLR